MAPPPAALPDAVLLAKQRLRMTMRQVRVARLEMHAAADALAIAAQGLGFLTPLPGVVVAAYASLPDELDTGPLLTRLLGEGFRLALPVMQGRTRPLLFRAWTPGDAMGRGLWGIAEPQPGAPAVEPDILLVPLLAVDARGWRLGYGGGYYDRTLRELRSRRRIVAVGLACDVQLVDAIPHHGSDEPLDWVLTPSGPRRSA